MSGAERIDPDELLANAGWVRRLARGIVADDASADDVVQQTMAAAWERPPREGTPLRPWLARVARNFALRARRGDARRAARETAAADARPSPPSPADLVARAEAFRAVTDAVLALEPAYRDVVLLRWFDGLETSEIAARLGVPPETVRTRLKRAHATLRDRLDREHGGRAAWLLLLGVRDEAPSPAGTRGAPPGGGAGPSVATWAARAAGGLLVGKKLAATAAVVLLVAAAGWGTWTATRPSPAAAPHEEARRATDAARPPAARADRPDAAAAGPAEAPVRERPAGPSVRGRVVDASDRPVAGATLVASPMPEWSRFVGGADATSARSGPDGAFLLPVDDTVPTFRILADGKGCAPAVVDSVRAGDEVVLRLAAPGTISGTVFTPEGKPVPGARVEWIAPLQGRAALVRRAVAGADGRYRIADLPAHRGGFGTDGADATTITAEADGFARVFVRATVPHARLPETVDLYLVRGAVVEGVVVDGEKDAPVPGVRVVLTGLGYRTAPAGTEGLVATAAGPVLAETRTDAAGAFRFEHAPAHGVHRLWANASGARGDLVARVTAGAPGFAAASDEFPGVEDGTRVSARIVLWPAAEVAGRVLGADGKGLPGVRVSAFTENRRAPWPADLAGFARPPVARTDAEGRYRIEAVPAARDAAVTATIVAEPGGREGDPAAVRPTVPVAVRAGVAAEAPDLVVGADGAPSVVVRVTDAEGRPVHGARVSRTQWVAEAVTGRDGRARIVCGRPGVAVPPLRLVVRAAGHAPGATDFVTPAADAPECGVALGPPRRLAGRVVHPDGTPAAGVVVTAATAEVPAGRVFSDDDLHLGELHLGMAGPVEASFPAVVLFGQSVSGPDGTFSLTDLPGGSCRLRAARPGAVATVAGPFPTDTADAVLTVPAPPAPPAAQPGERVEVTVLDAESRVPVTSCIVTLSLADGRELHATHPGGIPSRWGTSVFPVVPEGECVVRVRSASHPAAAATVVVRSGAANRFEVPLARGATVTGTVAVPDGVRPEDVTVWLGSEDRPGEWCGGAGGRPDAGGAFAIRGVSAGRWRVHADRAGTGARRFAAEPVSIDVPEGAREVRADVRVVVAGTLRLTWPSVGDATVRVTVRDAAGRTVWDTTHMRDTTETEIALAPGSYDVEIGWTRERRERIPPFRVEIAPDTVTRAGPGPR